MGDIIKNLKKVFNIGKKYNKHFVCFVIGSINAIIINVIYPLFAAKQLLFIADNLYKELIGVGFNDIRIYSSNSELYLTAKVYK